MISAGDFVHVDFSPHKGREQGGARPALVLSTAAYHELSEMAVVCPVTRNAGAWPYKVAIPEGEPVQGMVLVDQLRAVHRASRGFRLIGPASAGLLEAVRACLADMLLIERAH